jgi:hypothetical protein
VTGTPLTIRRCIRRPAATEVAYEIVSLEVFTKSTGNCAQTPAVSDDPTGTTIVRYPHGATPIENLAGESREANITVSSIHALYRQSKKRFAAPTERTISRKTDSPRRPYPIDTSGAAGLVQAAGYAIVAFELSRESHVPQDGNPSKTAGCGCHGKVSAGSPA